MGDKIELKQVNEREIWVNETKIYLSDNNIIYDTVIGEPDEKIAIKETEAILKLANLVEGKINIFIDLNKSGKPTAKARVKYRELAENSKVRKIAFFGLHPVARVIASFFIGTLTNIDVIFTKTKEEAIAYLRNNKK